MIHSFAFIYICQQIEKSGLVMCGGLNSGSGGELKLYVGCTGSTLQVIGFFCYFSVFLLATMKLGQGNVFTGVCDSVNKGEGVSASVHAGIPNTPQGRHPPALDTLPPPGADIPLGADAPWEQTPPRSRHLSGADTPQSRHPPGSRHPPEQTPPWEQTTPQSRHPLGSDTPQNRHPPGSRHPLGADTPSPGSRHPPE